VTGYGLDDGGIGVRVSIGSRIIFMSSRPAVGPTQLRINWLPGALSLGVKWLGHEAGHSPPTSAEVKKCGSVHPFPHMLSWHSVYFIKHRDNFTFLLYIAILFILVNIININFNII
jgi:hypothetical protein